MCPALLNISGSFDSISKYLSVNNYIQKRILLVVCGDDEKHAVKEE
jgi:hypothetical protein